MHGLKLLRNIIIYPIKSQKKLRYLLCQICSVAIKKERKIKLCQEKEEIPGAWPRLNRIPIDNSNQKVSRLASRINANNNRLLVSRTVCLSYASLLTDTFHQRRKFFDFYIAEMAGKSIKEVQWATRYLRSETKRSPLGRHSTSYIAIRCALVLLTLEYEITVRKIPFSPYFACYIKYIEFQYLRDSIVIFSLCEFFF